MKRPMIIFAAMLALGACGDSAVQTTSGAAYLSKYQPVTTTPQTTRQTRYVNGERVDVDVETVSTDALVRMAATIEPILTLPARIGLARIENGRLSPVPAGDAALWKTLAERYPMAGEFAELDPFIATYATLAVLPGDTARHRRDAHDIITKIRIGAARQHMDAVLIYEVGARGDAGGHRTTRLHPLRVLGKAPLPATRIRKEGVARAFLMDVRNGYPYGITSVSVDLEPIETPWWQDEATDDQAIKARTAITAALTPKIEALFARLTERMHQRVAQAK